MPYRLIYLAVFSWLSVLYPTALQAADSLIMLQKNGIRTSATDNPALALTNATRLNSLLKKHAGSGKWLVLPEGSTWIGKPLMIPSGTRIMGHPKGSSIQISSSFGRLQEGFIVNQDFILYTAKTNYNIEFKNFKLAANNVIPATGQPRGFFLNKVHQVTFKNVSVLNTAAEAIRIDVTNPLAITTSVLIDSCHVQVTQSSTPALMVRSHTLSGNNVEMEPARTSQIQIRNCTVKGGSHNIMLFNVADARVANNRCEDGGQRGIILSPTCSRVQVSKNKVTRACSTGIHLAYNCTEILIESNEVSGTVADQSGIGIEGQGIKAYAGFRQLTIRGNACTNNATDGIALEGGGEGDGFLIENNTCAGNKRNGIRLVAGALTINKPADLLNGIVQFNLLEFNKGAPIYVGSDNRGQNKVRQTSFKQNKPDKNARQVIQSEYQEITNVFDN